MRFPQIKKRAIVLLELRLLRSQLEKYKNITEHRTKYLSLLFLSGVVHGVGIILGMTLVVGVLLWLLSQLTIIPIIGDWLNALVSYIEANSYWRTK
jgi:hypothetical protein